nr:MAG TPA: hypothetical protein [Caudoviricetes sp.]
MAVKAGIRRSHSQNRFESREALRSVLSAVFRTERYD